MATESMLDSQALAANKNVQAREYWKKRLAGFAFNPYFESYDAPAPAPGGAYGRHAAKAPAHTTARLHEIAPSAKAKHMVLLSVLGVLAHKCSGGADVCVGTPLYAGNGEAAGTPPWIPVRMDDFARMTFPAFVVAVKDHFMGDLAHGNYPLAKILGDAADEADPALAGIRVEEVHPPAGPGSAPFGVLFSFRVTGELALTATYDAARFDPAYVAQLTRLYLGLLGALLGDRSRTIGATELIPAEEKDLIIHRFNRTEKAFPHGQTLLDLFAGQAAAHPGRVAVRCGDQQLTYGQLHARSNQVARYLSAHLPGRGAAVGVQLDRSPELIIAIFGVLKAGCVYVPLTRNYPPERVKYVLADSGARLLLTDQAPAAEVLGPCACADPRDLLSGSEADLNLARPAGVAYIIYTSGSTGMPKGVPIRHRSVVNRLNWMQHQYPLAADDRILQKTPVTFDVSVWELFWWSMYGAQLVLAAPGAEKDPAALCEVMDREKITVLHFVPSMLNAMLGYLRENGHRHDLGSLRNVFTSGEELKPADARLWLGHCPQAGLHNLYGPTEATVDVSYFPVSAPVPYRRVPIGKPIDNTTLLIFNPDGQLQPLLIPGELYIGGENLSVGYLNRPELTRDRFVPNPLRTGEVLYKTGDLARWLPDGNIEFLGRIDQQVKIRGNRVEPAEIEEVLKSCDGVQNAVVLPKAGPSGLQLIAYTVGRPGLEDEALRAFLGERLPEYMIPSGFVPIAEVPVTPNGKADRKRLLSLEIPSAAAHVAPSTPLEAALAAQWEQVLGHKKIGVNDHFFRIGGDSILGVRLIGAINNALSVRLSIPDLFNHPTIKALAGYLEGTPFGDVTAAYEPVAAELARFSEAYLSSRRDPDIEAAYPMSDIEKGMCFIDRAHVDDLLYFEQNLSSIFYKHFDLAVAQRALDLLVEKHEALRTGFDLDAYAHVVYRHLPARIVYRDLSLLPRAGQETTIKRELAASRQAHFDLSAVPLWRIRIYKLSDHYHELVFETHHALFDGWSYSSFIAEFNNTYVALLENKSLRLEKLACGYQDFIVEELYQKKNQETKNYWKAQLKDYKKLTLPAASAEKSFKPVRRHSSAGLVQELGKAAGDRNTTVKTILLAAHLYALKVLSCETDILIGLVTFNRPLKKDGEKLLGCFLNTIPFRVKFPDALTWQAYLALLDEKLLEVKKYESLSLMEIKEAVGIGTSEENPFFDSLFNFINFHVLEGLWRAETTEPQEGTLQLENFLRGNTFFDVNLHVSDGGIYAMYELVSPFMDEENFRNYLQVYDAAVRNIIETPEATLDPVSAYWQAKAAAVTGQLAQYRREVPAAAGGGALLPVSYQQERLWRMYPGGTNRAGQGAKAHQAIHLVIDLAGGVSVARLEESIRAVVRKHSALRTHLVEVDHQPFQRVGDAGAFALPLEVIHPDAAAAHVESIRQRPFEPGKPLFRAVLVRPGAGEYRLVFTLHRLIADGYAADRVWEEIQEAYRGQTGREAIAEERLPLQYGDFARWQRECLSPLGAYLRPYDQSLLGPGPYPARLPLFDPSPAAPAYVDAAVAVAVPRPLARQLTLYGAQTGVEVRVLLLAAYAVLLHKYTQQDDVLVGTAADNRNSELLRDVIGPVEALQWVRSVLAPGLSFGAYAAALAATYRERVRYPVFSPAALAEESFPAPHPGHNAPFSAFYRYEETPAPPGGTGVGRIVARLHPADAGPDLSLLLTQCGDQITGALHYNGARSGSFCPNTLVNHLYGLLEQCLAQPERPLAQTGLASDREKAQILNAFNRTATAYPRDKTIVELFEAQARQTPDWIAVAEGDKRFTYRQLDAQATRIACVLQRHHVRAGEPVAVLADRSADAVAAFIGILKAGGGYLPLDVNHPAGQLEYMLADSGARVVLCQTAYAGRVAAPVTRVDLGTALAEDGGQPVPCPRTPADLAYVMYTSGSTGRPKGVAVTHRNVVRLVKNTTYVPLNENTRILQTGAPAFDATTFEIWGSLLNGGTLCIAPQETLLDSDLLEQALSQYGVNTLWLTSSLFDQHAQANAALFKPLAYLLVGGDALTPRFINHVRSVQPHLVVINGYGPTENTTFSVCHRIDRAYADNIPIGRPISNSTAYIVDGAGNLQPVGVPGELWVGGDGVARGYLNNEALTREKFVPNPFVPGETLYKTGDTAKWLPDGTIVFLGRRDGQVKIRGYRIEPGEIENALLAYGGVKEAVVLVRETNGEKYLIAYYTAAVEVGEAPLTRHLSERLPEYMVPAHCVHLQRLPLTPNGKLDRAALPGPAPKAVTHAAPLSRTQQELLDIWAEVLGRRSEEIGLHSNFFEMGGNSIKLMRMVNRVNQAFQVRIPVARMFKLPAIAAIAEYLTGTPEVPAQSAEADAPDVLQLNETLALMDRLQE